MNHVIESGQSTDAFANKLVDGDTIQFTASTFSAGATVNAKNNCKVCAFVPPRPLITVLPGHDGVHVPRGVSGVAVDGLDFSIPTKINAACSVSGKNCSVSNITQLGAGRLLTMNAAEGLTADMLISTNGQMAEYAIWGALDGALPAHGPIDCKLLRFDIVMPFGMHAIRLHKFQNLTIGDPTLTLPATTFAGRINYTSPYRGAALTLKEGASAQIIRVQTFGPVGLGPNDAEIPRAFNPANTLAGDPNWESLRLDGVHIVGCEFNVDDRFFRVQAGCLNVLVENTTIIPKPGYACIALDGPRSGPNGGWPASTGEFRNVVFQGARLINDTSAALLKNWTFTNCMLGNKQLAPNGTVIEPIILTTAPTTKPTTAPR